MINLKKLKQLVQEYDKEKGTFPEHELEGACFYNWVLEKQIKSDKEFVELMIKTKEGFRQW